MDERLTDSRHAAKSAENRETTSVRRKFRIGVLIIGSLRWDDKPHRQEWRRDRLRMDNRQYVKVPIRYGRYSETRKGYTMVFSPGLGRAQFGQAIVVPCARDMTTGEDLVQEAARLWTAETSDGKNLCNRISAACGWGCVALLENPNGSVPDDPRECWAKRVSEESPRYGEKIISAYGEELVVNRRGFLKIPWPTPADSPGLNFDALLATATRPTLRKGCYPSPEDVACVNRTGKGRRYFRKNRKHGIETFQDAAIKDWWAKRDESSEGSSK